MSLKLSYLMSDNVLLEKLNIFSRENTKQGICSIPYSCISTTDLG